MRLAALWSLAILHLSNSVLGDEWLKYKGKQYLFGDDVKSGVNYFEAQLYCREKDGFLAEPDNADINKFLKGQAAGRVRGSWWTGLRGTNQTCQCTCPGNTRSPVPARVGKPEEKHPGFARGWCERQQGSLSCKKVEKDWKWAHNGEQLTYNDWGKGEPHRESNTDPRQEYCAIMWNKLKGQWADFPCMDVNYKGKSPFRPMCQKYSEQIPPCPAQSFDLKFEPVVNLETTNTEPFAALTVTTTASPPPNASSTLEPAPDESPIDLYIPIFAYQQPAPVVVRSQLNPVVVQDGGFQPRMLSMRKCQCKKRHHNKEECECRGSKHHHHRHHHKNRHN